MGAVHDSIPAIGEKVISLEASDRYVVITFESGINISVYAGGEIAAAKLVKNKKNSTDALIAAAKTLK